MKLTAFLLALTCATVYICGVQAECCRRSQTLHYIVAGGFCADAGGYSGNKNCTITICADGNARVGTYCGRGSCNIFGCACKNGCITGNWKQSFLDINRGHWIIVTDQKWD